MIAGLKRAEAAARARELLGLSRPRGAREPSPGGTVGRRAAARRHRPRARQRAARPARRRADRQPRPQDRRPRVRHADRARQGEPGRRAGGDPQPGSGGADGPAGDAEGGAGGGDGVGAHFRERGRSSRELRGDFRPRRVVAAIAASPLPSRFAPVCVPDLWRRPTSPCSAGARAPRGRTVRRRGRKIRPIDRSVFVIGGDQILQGFVMRRSAQRPQRIARLDACAVRRSRRRRRRQWPVDHARRVIGGNEVVQRQAIRRRAQGLEGIAV